MINTLKTSVYDLIMPQSQIIDQPLTPIGRGNRTQTKVDRVICDQVHLQCVVKTYHSDAGYFSESDYVYHVLIIL